MIYPVKKVFITQEWGVNKDIYSRFGYLGHNGVDFRIYDSNGIKAQNGELIAPHDGKIIEARFDKDGYGWYYKIENDIEGSILGHNDELFLTAGSTVKQGQVIGRTGNTGFSTAPHVHWGYYRFPRNKQNGYGGTINQIPLMEGNEDMTLYKGYDLDNKDSMKVAVDVLVRLNNGEFIDKPVHEELKKNYEASKLANKELDEKLNKCQNQAPQLPLEDNMKWKLNGKIEETIINGVKIIKNYAIDESK